MAATDSLPILLIIAKDKAAVDEIIKEVVRDARTEQSAEGTVWVIANKYYTARALLLPVTEDGDPPPSHLLPRVEALIVAAYTTEGGAGAGSGSGAVSVSDTVSRRVSGEVGGAGEVRLWATDVDAEEVWERAHALRLEPLLWPAEAPRAREALHAHTWTGLREVREPAEEVPPPHLDDGDDLFEHDTFSALLAAVRRTRALAPALRTADRHRRAQQLLAAVMRAPDMYRPM